MVPRPGPYTRMAQILAEEPQKGLDGSEGGGYGHVAAYASVNIGFAVPSQPIGPWSRRTGAPEASATGRGNEVAASS